ncbi:sulfate anion transporter, conserved site [Sesbania bispinosa]|nr:sulfate anion transporter, conserved site [Sesbania bispinosa]
MSDTSYSSNRQEQDSSFYKMPIIKFTKLFINGDFVDSVSGKTFETIDPRTGEVTASISEGDKEDIDIAVKAAREAFDSGPWPRMSGVERAKIMMKWADLIDQNREELAALETIDSGKLYHSTMVLEIPAAASTLRYYAGAADKIHGEVLKPAREFHAYTLLEPIGVVGHIIPWNAPTSIFFTKVSPSLAVGCTMAGIPNGVLNVVPGFGPTAGAAISSHMDIDAAIEVGREVMQAAARSNLKPVSLELGGKSPLIIFDDADIDKAAELALLGILFNKGEACVASSRVFVHEGIYDEFEKKLVEKAKAWIVGDPFDPKTQQGPQAYRNQFKKILSYIEHGKREGATLLTGGKTVGSKGYYIEPTIFSDVKEDMLIAQDEIFGPVMALMKFKTIDEAIKSANNTKYGLAAGIVTKNLDTANTMSRSIRAGTIWINCYFALGSDIPFGGYKMSGFGRDLGLEALHNLLSGAEIMRFTSNSGNHHAVNFNTSRGFLTKLKIGVKETFFPDDLFRHSKNKDKPLLKWVQYFVPIFEWLPTYTWRMFYSDFLAGLTITSLAVPQSISFAKLANLPPIIGLYSSFVPPLVYAIFGSSRHISVGTTASLSMLIYQNVSTVANPEEDLNLYIHLVFTTTFIAGAFQACLGILRLGILVDFLSGPTITGFIGGSATILGVQQLKGIFGIKYFLGKMDLITRLKGLWTRRHEMRWETIVPGVISLVFLQFTKYLRNKNPKLFWLSALAPMTTVITAGVLTYYPIEGQRRGIQMVGHVDKGINPFSIQNFNFDSKYLPVILKAGFITGVLSLAEGIAIGRSFSVIKNTPHDGIKEMIASGLMNLCGSFTSCYMTTGTFSKTAVNYSAGCETAMSNIVQALLMALVLKFLTPFIGHIPLFALSAITVSAVMGLINYTEVIYFYKVDKFDFIICMTAFLGVIFIASDVGFMLSVGLSVLRALLHVARPAACKLGKLPDLDIYRDVEQYTVSTFPGVLILQLGSPIYFANSSYIKERIMRYIRSEQDSNGQIVEQIILDLSGVTSIDTTAIEVLLEINKILERIGIKKSCLPLGIYRPSFWNLEVVVGHCHPSSDVLEGSGKKSLSACYCDERDVKVMVATRCDKHSSSSSLFSVASW